jgi:hypothetical protein
MFAHSVFFSLQDHSATAVQSMVDACKKSLPEHPGIVFFAVGTINKELTRQVNDQDFDVALHIVFDSKASHDAYQVAPSHQQFVHDFKPKWRQVRVFDADVDVITHS